MNSRIAKLIGIGILVVVILTSSVASAQNGKPLGATPNESNQGIDLYTGRTGFNVPIIETRGRGEAEAALTVGISQPQWEVREILRIPQSCGPYGNGCTPGSAFYGVFPAPKPFTNASQYLNPGSIRIRTRGSVSSLGLGFSDAISNVIEFTSSDGQTFELRDTLRDGEFSVIGGIWTGPLPNNNCNVNLFGPPVYGIPTYLPPSQVLPPTHPSCNRGNIFRATDGSGITFVADENIYDATVSIMSIGFGVPSSDSYGTSFGKAKGTLYLPNGTKYRFDTGIVANSNGLDPFYSGENSSLKWIEDRNGNRTEFTYNTSETDCNYLNGPVHVSCYKLTKITDSINREITISYGDFLQDAYFDTVTYKGSGGSERQIKINHNRLQYALKPNEVLKSPAQLFPSVGEVMLNSNSATLTAELDEYKKSTTTESSLVSVEYNPQVITSIVLPNNQQYSLLYNSYGELARTISPLGSYTDLEYGAINDSGADVYGVMFETYGGQGNPFPLRIHRRGTEVNIFDSANVLQTKTTYSGAGGINPVTVKQFGGDGTTLLSAMKHYFFNGSDVPSIVDTDFSIFSHNSWKQNREYKTETLDTANLNIVLRKTESTFEQRQPVSWWRPPGHPDCQAYTVPILSVCLTRFEPQNDPRLTELKSTLETGQVTKKIFSYDQFNNITDTYEYDFGNGQAGQLLRRSHTDYVTDTNYTSYNGAHLKNLSLQTWISSDIDGNNKVSLSHIEYDNYNVNPLLPRGNVSGHNLINYSTSNIRRGNATKITSYSDVNNQSTAISTQTQFDILGNVVKAIDARGNTTEINYADNFGSPDNDARSTAIPIQLNGKSTFAYPTSSTNALGWEDVGYSQFDYYTGSLVNSEDINGVISKTIYNDLLDRPTQTVTAIGAPNEKQSRIIYDHVNHRTEARSDLFTLNDNLSKSESFYDDLGRTFETRKYELDGGYVKTNTEFNDLGRAKKATNPYRPLKGETPVWTETFYDSLGRVVKVKTPDNAEVTTSYFGNAVTVTDQAGKKSRSVTNASGQLTRVDEPNDAGSLDVNGVPAQSTNYVYDTLNNLITVNQGVQMRSFEYDSLSRLKQANNPESGVISYTYDENSNIKTKRDARGIKTIYDYDNLNRVLKRCYRVVGTSSLGLSTCTANNETPEPNTSEVSFTYDNLPNARGKLTKVENGTSTTEYTNFDILGRVLNHKQITDGNTYNSSYVYNLSSALIEETYPSGRVVKNTLDQDGDLALVQSKKLNGTFQNYANAFTYTSAGAVSSLRLGNGKFENTQFNSRLQPIQIGLGSSSTNQNLLKLNFEYGGVDNNGNVKSQMITTPTVGNVVGFAATHNYTYDSLNRIKQATEVVTGQPTQGWQQTFVYDRYGNRTFEEANTTTLTKNCGISPNKIVCASDIAKFNPSANVSDNKLVGTNYDSVGNTKVDANGQVFTYDAENRQTKVVNAQGVTLGEYFYNGDGKRIKKIVSSTLETTIFVYDANDKVVAEYSTITPSATDAKISYLTNDNLGSPRINTDAYGQVIARHDFLPFGEEIPRSSYGNDSVRQKFTGYEHDRETDLYFAQARMFGSTFGRFTSPDPLMASAKRALPQSWNRYSYVLNNPLNLVDPSGLVWGRRTINGITTYHWFSGKISKKNQDKGWTEYTGSPIINTNNYGLIRLNNDGSFTELNPAWNLPADQRGTLSARKADILMNATGGLLCSLSVGLACVGDADSKVFQNAKGGADLVQMAFLIKSLVKAGVSLGVIAMMIKKNPDDVAKLAAEVIGKGYEVKQCLKCAEDLMEAFTANGIKGTIRQLDSPTGQAIMQAGKEGAKETVASTGHSHYGVQVGDLIYEMNSLKGIPISEWASKYTTLAPNGATLIKTVLNPKPTVLQPK